MLGILYGVISASVVFALYAELHPQLGNIWWRIGDKGTKELCPMSLVNLMLSPFRSLFLWHPQILDTNFALYATLGGLLGYLLG
jgi:hypothetical protein